MCCVRGLKVKAEAPFPAAIAVLLRFLAHLKDAFSVSCEISVPSDDHQPLTRGMNGLSDSSESHLHGLATGAVSSMDALANATTLEASSGCGAKPLTRPFIRRTRSESASQWGRLSRQGAHVLTSKMMRDCSWLMVPT